jgi:hypothetical protein
MNFFHWVGLFDVVAMMAISALILRLAFSRPGDEARSELVEIVQTIVGRLVRGWNWVRRPRFRRQPPLTPEPLVVLTAGGVSELQ